VAFCFVCGRCGGLFLAPDSQTPEDTLAEMRRHDPTLKIEECLIYCAPCAEVLDALEVLTRVSSGRRGPELN
jgi:hypothetical protein